MIEQLNVTATRIGDTLIDMSAALDGKMEKWSDIANRSNNVDTPESAGFVNKETATSGLSLVVDIQVPANEDEAILRTWGIESKLGEDQVEHFNNIQLDFAVSYSQARNLAKKGSDVSRNDIRTLLHDQDTKLKCATVSNEAGLDQVSHQRLGERYDLMVGESDDDKALVGKINDALDAVIIKLEKSAEVEKNS